MCSMHAGIYMSNKLPRELNYSENLLNRATEYLTIESYKISNEIKHQCSDAGGTPSLHSKL